MANFGYRRTTVLVTFASFLAAVPELAYAECPVLYNSANEGVAISDDPFFINQGWTKCTSKAGIHERCTLMCKDGYYWLSGDFSRQCQANSLWNGNELVCGPNCPDKTTNSDVTYSGSCTSAEAGDKCSQVCSNRLFEPASGDAQLTCKSDGTWSGAPIQCTKPVPKCDENLLGSFNIGSVNKVDGNCVGTEKIAGDTCHLTCKNGYRLKSGDEERTCQRDGKWSGSPIVCEKIPTCGQTLNPGSNAINNLRSGESCAGGSTSGTVCRQRCKNNEYMDAASKVAKKDILFTCGEDGKWSGGPLNCEVRPACDKDLLAEGENNNAVYWKWQCNAAQVWSTGEKGVLYGEWCAMKCSDPLYYVHDSGSWKRMCEVNGEWGGVPFKCKHRPVCTEDLDVNAGSRNVVSTSEAGTCKPGTLPSGAFGALKDSACIQMCANGFRRTGGDNVRTCQDDGTWSGEPLQCEAKPSCAGSALSGSSNAETVNEGCDAGSFSGDECTLRCSSRHIKVSGSTSRTCGEDGQWTGSPLVCELADPNSLCKDNLQTTAVDRSVITTSGMCGDTENGVNVGVVPGTKCTQTCKDASYVVVSGADGHTLTCLSNGQWSKPPLVCEEKKMCPDLNETLYEATSFSKIVQPGLHLSSMELSPSSHNSICSSAYDGVNCTQRCTGAYMIDQFGFSTGDTFINQCRIAYKHYGGANNEDAKGRASWLLGCGHAAESSTLEECQAQCNCDTPPMYEPRCSNIPWANERCEKACQFSFTNLVGKVRANSHRYCAGGKWSEPPLVCKRMETCPVPSDEASALSSTVTVSPPKMEVYYDGNYENFTKWTDISKDGKDCQGDSYWSQSSRTLAWCRDKCEMATGCEAFKYANPNPNRLPNLYKPTEERLFTIIKTEPANVDMYDIPGDVSEVTFFLKLTYPDLIVGINHIDVTNYESSQFDIQIDTSLDGLDYEAYTVGAQSHDSPTKAVRYTPLGADESTKPLRFHTYVRVKLSMTNLHEGKWGVQNFKMYGGKSWQYGPATCFLYKVGNCDGYKDANAGWNHQIFRKTPPGGGAYVGGTADYSCPDFYDSIGGDTTRTCQPDGTWSGRRFSARSASSAARRFLLIRAQTPGLVECTTMNRKPEAVKMRMLEKSVSFNASLDFDDSPATTRVRAERMGCGKTSHWSANQIPIVYAR